MWAFFEYYKSGNAKWTIVIGIFAGFAVLTKWLTGLLIYLLWFFIKVYERQDKVRLYLDYLTAFATTVVIAIPWQIHIINVFPLESVYEYNLNTRHFFEEIEGHAEIWYCHFAQFHIQYGFIGLFTFPIAFYCFSRDVKNKIYLLFFVSAILFIYFLQ